MRKQKMCEGKKAKVHICESHENEDLDEDLVEDLDLNQCRRHLQISIVKRPMSRAGQGQKQQSGIDSAGVCCFKLLGFELFESLLIGAS